jgi:hypothetical protein
MTVFLYRLDEKVLPLSGFPRRFSMRLLSPGFRQTGLIGFLVLAALFAVNPLAQALAVPRSEHPRPDALRTNWMTLNGEWQFEVDSATNGEARGLVSGQDLAGKIQVPFCPESRLSGYGFGNTNYFENAWYRRYFNLPSAMNSRRILLHFGAVDYKAWVYLNGQLAGEHTGGNAPFICEITSLIRPGGNELVLRVHDALRSGLQPGGKQSYVKSDGGDYTRTTGIWQPVWLEAVGSSYVENFSIVPDPDHSRVLIEASVNGADSDLKLTAEAYANGKRVGIDSTSGSWRNQRLVLNLSRKTLWEPGAPFLYDLKFTLRSKGRKVDELQSYFGLRKIVIEGRRILINDRPVFQRLILDQGFYPDGLWTAPSDEALKHDIEMSMAAGYNGARLHQKVFEPRYLYWADRLGYMVWGEFPNSGYHYSPAGYAPYITEWTEVLLRDRNHPSIIGWCPFNETSGRAAEIQQVVWNVTRAIDPTRPALECSGWSHSLPHPEVLDSHNYEGNPATLRQHWKDYFSGAPGKPGLPARYSKQTAPNGNCGVPFMISEMGGIGWGTEGGWSYGDAPKTEEAFYTRYEGTVNALLDNPNLFGFCYTQLTDIEQEHNGLYYYDRRPKFDLKRLHALTSRQSAYERGAPGAPVPAIAPDPWKVLVGGAQDGRLSTPWHYSTGMVSGDWTAATFDDSAWPVGSAPFGKELSRPVRTEWSTADIYLRKTLEFDGAAFEVGAVVVLHGGDSEIYLNGRKLLGVGGRVGRYFMNDVTAELKKFLHKGVNTLAVHSRQSTDGQYIDVAILCL